MQGKTEERSFLYLTVRDSKSSSGQIRKGYGKALGQFNQSLLLPHLPPSKPIQFHLLSVDKEQSFDPSGHRDPKGQKALREGTEPENRMSL